MRAVGRRQPMGVALALLVGLAFCQRAPGAGPPLAFPSPPLPAAPPPVPTEPPFQPALRFQWGFRDASLQVVWSPRRPWLALASLDRLYVYHFPSLRLLLFVAEEGGFRELAFAADGETLIGRLENGALKAWDVSSRRERWSRSDMPGVGLVPSPDPRRFAVGHADGSIRLLDPITGWERQRLPGQFPLSFSPDGALLVVCPTLEEGDPLSPRCSPAEALRVVEGATGRARRPLASVTPPLWAPDGRALVGRADGTVSAVDLSTGEEMILWRRPGVRIQRLLGLLDGRWLVIQYDGTVALVDRRTGATRELGNGESAALSPDGATLAWVEKAPPALVLMDLRTGAARRVALDPVDPALRPPSSRLAFSPDGRWLAVQRWEGWAHPPAVDPIAPAVRIWDVAAGAERYRFFPRLAPVWDLAFSPDGTVLAAPEGRSVRLRALQSGRASLLPLRTADGLALAFSAGGRWLAVGLADGSIRLYRYGPEGEWRADRVWIGHEGPVRRVIFSPDGRRLASASWDRTVRVWEIVPGGEPLRLEGHAAEVWDVAFSPDGGMLISAGEDGTVHLWWESAGGWIGQLLAAYPVPAYRVAFSPDGRWLAVGLADGTVRLWDVAARVELRVLGLRARAVRALAFSPDGWLLAAGGEGRDPREWDLRVWSIPEGGERGRWGGLEDALYSLAFSPDGAQLALGFRSGVIQVWQLQAAGARR